MGYNLVKCKNNVVIEGVDFGEFEAFSLKHTRGSFGATALLTLPIYGIGIRGVEGLNPGIVSEGRARNRMSKKLENNPLKVGARVEVYCWYDGWDKHKVFDGFIERVAEGYPTKFYLRDATFILKFGKTENAYNNLVKLGTVASDVIANAINAFSAYRSKHKLTSDIPEVTYVSNQAKGKSGEDTEIFFDNFAKGRSAYDIIAHLQDLLACNAGIVLTKNASGDDIYGVYIGAYAPDSGRSTINLSTATNVIHRDIVPVGDMFTNFEVQVTGLLDDGRRCTVTANNDTGTSTSYSEKDSATTPKVGDNNITHRKFLSGLVGETALSETAINLLKELTGLKNKGTITLLMYPKCELLDTVKFTDTVFNTEEQFYVLEYTFTANDRGYFQKLGVTNEIFRV